MNSLVAGLKMVTVRDMVKLLFNLILALPLLLAAKALKAQAVIHVPGDRPTIQAGIDAASNGDTVLVAPGTYNENIDFKGKDIVVTSGSTNRSGAASVVLSGQGGGPVVTLQSNEPVSARLNGMTVTNGSSVGVYILNSSGTIENNVITKNAGCAIVVRGTTSSTVFRDNEISYTSFLPTCGILPTAVAPAPGGATAIIAQEVGDVVIEGNLIHDNGYISPLSGAYSGGAVEVAIANSLIMENNFVWNNIFQGAQAPLAENVRSANIVQNLIYSNKSPGSAGTQVFQRLSDYPSDTRIADETVSLILSNNTYYGNVTTDGSDGSFAGEQIYLLGPFTQSTVANNLFIGTGLDGSASCVDGAETTIPFNNNDIFSNAGPQAQTCGQAAGKDALTADPQFINAVNADFHTKPTSPVIYAGDINAPDLPATDLDGKNRTVCGKIDMGVYQHHPHSPIVLTASGNPSAGGNNVTFTAQLTGNCNVPTGIVTFFDGATPIGTGTLNGSAVTSLTTDFLVVGQHSITARYPGDFNFEDSTSNAVIETVTGFATATSLSVAPNPATAFQPIILSATVTASYGTPSGTVTFQASGNGQTINLGTATLNAGGVVTLSTGTLGAGTYNVVATFNATTQYASSTSAAVVEVVVGAASSVTLRAAPNPISLGQSVGLTATVVPAQSASPTPTGSVSFLDSGVSLGSVPLSAGVAVLNTSSLTLGSHTITASYSGSGNYNAGVSNAVVVVVTTIPTSISVTGSPNPANLGAVVTFTATAAGNGAATTPSGLVTFADSGATIGTAQLGGNGIATFTSSTLTAGTHPITATLSGGSTFDGSVSPALAEVVTAYDFAVSTASGAVSLPSGGYTTLAINIVPLGGYTGTVQLSCGALPAHAQCVFSQSSASLAKGQQTVSLTLNTSDVYEYGTKVGRSEAPVQPGRSRLLPLYGVLLLPLLGLNRNLRRKINGAGGPLRLLTLALAATALFTLQACAGHLPGETAPGVYQIPITGTDLSSGQSHTAIVPFTVSP